MTETRLPQRSDHAEHRDTRNIKRLLRAMRRDPSTLSVDEMSCVCALSRLEPAAVDLVELILIQAAGLDHLANYDAVTCARAAELVRAVGDET